VLTGVGAGVAGAGLACDVLGVVLGLPAGGPAVGVSPTAEGALLVVSARR
jgi:hypothetical protein